MDALGLYDLFKELQIEEIAENSLRENEDTIVIFNQLQLYDGKRHDGQDIFPTYFDDPYFTSRQAAQDYSDWKDKITPSRKRTKGVPNLIINGYFHSTIEAKVEGGAVIINSTWGVSEDIEGKYSDEIYGLNEDSREIFIDQNLQETFQKKVTEITGLNFK